MKRKILFICTGNVFRSISAKYCLKQYLVDNNIKGFVVDSAGIIAKKQPIEAKIRKVLKELGIAKVVNRQKRLDRKMLRDYDIIIVMTKNHAEFIKSKFNFTNTFLFNELAVNKKTSLLDAAESNISQSDRKAWEEYIEKTIKYIHKNTPRLFARIMKLKSAV